MENDTYVEELYNNLHTNLLRELALNVILLENEEVNKSLFDYIQFVGDFELLGEVTRLTMNSGDKMEVCGDQ